MHCSGHHLLQDGHYETHCTGTALFKRGHSQHRRMGCAVHHDEQRTYASIQNEGRSVTHLFSSHFGGVAALWPRPRSKMPLLLYCRAPYQDPQRIRFQCVCSALAYSHILIFPAALLLNASQGLEMDMVDGYADLVGNTIAQHVLALMPFPLGVSQGMGRCDAQCQSERWRSHRVYATFYEVGSLILPLYWWRHPNTTKSTRCGLLPTSLAFADVLNRIPKLSESSIRLLQLIGGTRQ